MGSQAEAEKFCSSGGSGSGSGSERDKDDERARVSATSKVLWHARQNDVKGLKKVLEQDPCLVSAQDYDGRSPLHVAALYGCIDAARFLLEHGAEVNALDRWENSPLADAEGNNHTDTVELLKAHGGKSLGNHGSRLGVRTVAPPRPHNCDWEVDPSELDFSKSIMIGKGSFGEILQVSWRGTPVAVKRILPSLSDDKLVIQDFRHEVDLLVKLRHPNIVQFLGAVTKKPPLMLITEYLRGGDLHQYLKEKGALSPSNAVNFALDIARGMAYLHNEPNVIIHRDLKPRNVLLVNANHLKVGDFGLSKLIKAKHNHDMYKLTGETGSYRYMAPEVFKHRKYDAKVDVFSFAMILYEMFEGSAPFSGYDAYEAAKIVSKGDRPLFRAKTYPSDVKMLIEECWHSDNNVRPTFLNILNRLEKIKEALSSEHHWNILHHN
uniref:non-specific serine/threonine protein kinase n=1 Tax=Araucaria cunninghamii TaxID=56994 RepID=A0A0D6R4N9_ARACU